MVTEKRKVFIENLRGVGQIGVEASDKEQAGYGVLHPHRHRMWWKLNMSESIEVKWCKIL